MEFEMFTAEQEETHPANPHQICLISDLLSRMGTIGLEAEIVFSSLQAMRENPNLEPYEAMSIGFSEWVK